MVERYGGLARSTTTSTRTLHYARTRRSLSILGARMFRDVHDLLEIYRKHTVPIVIRVVGLSLNKIRVNEGAHKHDMT